MCGVRLFNLDTGACLRTFRGHQEAVRCVAFSADALRLASGSDDKTVRIFDVASGATIQLLARATNINPRPAAAFVDRPSYAASGITRIPCSINPEQRWVAAGEESKPFACVVLPLGYRDRPRAADAWRAPDGTERLLVLTEEGAVVRTRPERLPWSTSDIHIILRSTRISSFNRRPPGAPL